MHTDERRFETGMSRGGAKTPGESVRKEPLPDERILRQAIVEVGSLLYNRGLVVATDGNISIRLDRRHILISPTGICKGLMTEESVVRLSLVARRAPPGASSESPMHAAVYRIRPDVGAIIHAHPPYATGFAISGRKLDADLLPETRLFDGPVGRVGFLTPGSGKLADAVARALRKHNTCLLARHGAVAVGKNLLEAFYRLERLEFLARETQLARTQGRMAKPE